MNNRLRLNRLDSSTKNIQNIEKYINERFDKLEKELVEINKRIEYTL